MKKCTRKVLFSFSLSSVASPFMGQSSSDDKGARASGDLTQAQKGMLGEVKTPDFPFCFGLQIWHVSCGLQ